MAVMPDDEAMLRYQAVQAVPQPPGLTVRVPSSLRSGPDSPREDGTGRCRQGTYWGFAERVQEAMLSFEAGSHR